MLLRPSSCTGCALNPVAQGFMQIEGRPELGVTLMGEALGEEEAKQGGPFRGKAGFRFERMIERAGFKRGQFQILNAVWCRPPNNSEPPTEAIEHCRQYWEQVVTRPETKVIVPMGNVPLFATLGSEGILSKRGYVWWSDTYQAYVLPTVHPSYIMRGNSKWEAAWMYDLRHAVEIAAKGWEPVVRENLLDPVPDVAMAWAERYALRNAAQGFQLALGTDIETPDKSTAEDEVDISLGYLPGPIHRIGFGYIWAGQTLTLTVPWTPSYLEVIKFLLGLRCPKIFWYRHFDVPRIKAHGVMIEADIHDGAEAWHCLHSDLPKKLEHVTPFLVPNQPAWKHLNSGETAAFYNATDAGVQVENFTRLKELLTQHGMWELYERDIFGLNPILIHMSEQGMPVNIEKRKAASVKCAELLVGVQAKLNEVAKDARPSKIYTRFKEGLEEIEVDAEEKFCSECGKVNVNVKHPCFKVGTAPGEVPLGELRTRTVKAKGWVQPLDFKPSQKGLVRYAEFKGYKLITVWDRTTQSRKITMDETAIRKYALAHVDDPMWALALEERELKKLLGTYIGKLTDKPEKERAAESEWWEAFNRAQLRQTYVERPELQDRLPRHYAGSAGGGYVGDDDIPF
jgi:DNA polymerase